MLKKPLITEKTMLLAGRNQYTFMIFREATKLQIAKLVHEKFGVDVVSVKTVTIKGKAKRQRGYRGTYTTDSVKKAIVMLKPGQKIPLFEQAAAGEEEVAVTTAEGEQVSSIKEKKSLLKGTKIKVERGAKIEEAIEKEDNTRDAKKVTRQQAGGTKGEKA